RRRRGALEADEAVGIVLEHEQVALARELDEAMSPLGRERTAARVLKGRDRVEERRLRACVERLSERVEIEAVVVHRDGDHVGAASGEQLQRSVVRRLLDEHARTGKAVGEERESLQRAVRDENARRLDAMTIGDRLA